MYYEMQCNNEMNVDMYVIDHECVMDVYYEYVVYLDLESRAG